jgi:uncharacterized protein (TIGR02271 family)
MPSAELTLTKVEMNRSRPSGDADIAERLPLAEEQLHVETRQVPGGKVRVHTKLEVTNELIEQDLKAERVTVPRVPINRYVESAPPVRTEGELTVIPVLEEVLLVETKLLLKEEIHLQRKTTTETVRETVSLRKQRAVVETEPE